MFPKTVQDPEYPSSKGSRNDGRDLVSEWLKNKKVNGFVIILQVCSSGLSLCVNECYFLLGCHLNSLISYLKTYTIPPPNPSKNLQLICLHLFCLQNAKYVWNKAEFDAVNPANTDFLMGKKNS